MAHEVNQRCNPDLPSFNDLKTAMPSTKIGAIVALLPEIRRLKRRGHKTRAIWESLTTDGLQMSYDLFRLYLGRAHRRIAQLDDEPPTAPPKAGERTERPPEDVLTESGRTRDQHPISAAVLGADPFAAIRSSRKLKAKERFDYDPLAPLKEDLLR